MSISSIGFRGMTPFNAKVPVPAAAVKFTGNTPLVTDVDFQREVLDASFTRPVLVDFFAQWCPPCQRLGPSIDALHTDEQAKPNGTKVLKYDVDPQNRHKIMLKGAAKQYDVRNVPTLILFKNGQPVERSVGAIPREQLDALIAPHRN